MVNRQQPQQWMELHLSCFRFLLARSTRHTPDCFALLVIGKVVSDPDGHRRLEDDYCFIRVVFVLALGMNFGLCGAG